MILQRSLEREKHPFKGGKKRMGTIQLCTGRVEARLCRDQGCSPEPGGPSGTSKPDACCQKRFQQKNSATQAESAEEKERKSLDQRRSAAAAASVVGPLQPPRPQEPGGAFPTQTLLQNPQSGGSFPHFKPHSDDSHIGHSALYRQPEQLLGERRKTDVGRRMESRSDGWSCRIAKVTAVCIRLLQGHHFSLISPQAESRDVHNDTANV
ncbi:hypothetical protein D4764_17G0009550 [Takifugu flavidus]|uniref:Uncharacterized protein n=1 Tax=Takifugu flavidus TaxID=433684 RepID=A0A5C6NVE2_9TELE|nr:hypothetical protein D4764_17G0009550 [Takifugu flavidus]